MGPIAHSDGRDGSGLSLQLVPGVTTVIDESMDLKHGRTVPGLPRLAGILVGPFGRSAIFATNGAKPIVVQEGGRVAAYTIKSIEATQLRLLGPDGAQVLYPSFEPAASPARRPAQAPLSR